MLQSDISNIKCFLNSKLSSLKSLKLKQWDRLDTCRMLSGAIAGAVGNFVGYPIDTIKVRMQNNRSNQNTLRIAYNILKYEGIFSFYLGATLPVINRLFINSLFFATNGYIRSIEEYRTNNDILPLYKVGIIAGISGIIVTPIIVPIELIKVQLQKTCNINKNKPIDIIRLIFMYNEFNRGYISTSFRSTFGFGVYLFYYEWWNRIFNSTNVLGKNPVFKISGFAQTLIGGGLAGLIGWIISYPFDYIKTMCQSEPIELKKLKIREVLKVTYRNYGIKGFYRGITPCLWRSIPANMAIFTTYEIMFQFFRKHFYED